MKQKDIQLESHARVCSEDLMKNFAPVGGPVHIVSIDETAVDKLPRFSNAAARKTVPQWVFGGWIMQRGKYSSLK